MGCCHGRADGFLPLQVAQEAKVPLETQASLEY